MAGVWVGEFTELTSHGDLFGVEAESIDVRPEPSGFSEACSA